MQDNDEKLGYERLLKMARGVAQGMDYLSTIGFVHRVRPPRNFMYIPRSPNVLTQNIMVVNTDWIVAYEQI